MGKKQMSDSNVVEGSELLSAGKKGDFYIVGIGASAGGLEALEIFFNNMPQTNDMAFIVVQHLSPDYKSLMVELLSKHTKMTVMHAQDNIDILPNNVYLIPPKKHMTIYHRKLLLTDYAHQAQPHTLNLPIDIFFRSLAEDAGEKAIGVVLSGTGSDGTRGIRAIKEAGGLVIVQDGSTAKFDGMPLSAISTGLVDYILHAEKIPEELCKYVKYPELVPKQNIAVLKDDDSFNKIFAMIREKTSVDFNYYKQTTVVRRIERRMSINQMKTLREYADYLKDNPSEIVTLYKEILIGVTKFFRDPESFEDLLQTVIPAILSDKPSGSTIRVWISGCSTGEEAYSLAILFREYIEKNGMNYDVKIFSTDIDTDALDFASTGVYNESIVADVSESRLRKYFVQKGDTYQVARIIREMVVFAKHNILKDPPFSKIDLISCRNMLIYFQPILQKKVFSLFHFSLNSDGFLFLGSSESVGEWIDLFHPFNIKNKIYRYKGGMKPRIIDTVQMPDKISAFIERSKSSGLVDIGTSRGPSKPLENIYYKLIEDYVPACLIIDESFHLVHVFGDVDRFLKIPSGKTNLDVFKMFRDGLTVPLSSAIHKVKKEKKPVTFHELQVSGKNELIYIDVTVKEYSLDDMSKGKYYLIIFERVSNETIGQRKDESIDVVMISDQRIRDLEQELQYSRENLQATIEELETSNEELQATNEELLAANEELQSTNEELQSVNEELITVNSEYQSKITELSTLNNDINNLLQSTNIGTLFLDNEVCIRKFTPAVSTIINVINSDLGRPFSHISNNIKRINIEENIRSVMSSLIPIESEVETTNGCVYLMRILPYRTTDNEIRGVVITFIDISLLKKANRTIEKLKNSIESSLNVVMITDIAGKIEYVNPAFRIQTGYEIDEVIGKKPALLKSGLTPKSVYEEMWAKIKDGEVWSGELCNKKKNGEIYWVIASISAIRDENDVITGYLKVGIDITEKKESLLKYEMESAILSSVAESFEMAITVVNSSGLIVYANNEAEKLFGLNREEITARRFNDEKWRFKDEIEDAGRPFKIIMSTGKPLVDFKEVIEKGDGTSITLSITGKPVFNKSGNIDKIVFFMKRAE